MKDYKKKLEGVVNIINTTEKSDIGFANICTYIGEKCPELKESEDERIRKAIHIYLDWLDGKKDYAPRGEYTINDMIDWIEKQGNHSNFLSKIQVGDKVTRNEDGVLVNLSQLNRVAKKDKKQGEQNLIKHFCDCVHVGCHVNDCKRWCHSYQKEISYTDCNSNCNRYSKLMNHAFNIGETITDGISTFKIADIKDNYYIADDGERVEIYMAHRYYTAIQNLEAQKPTWSEEDDQYLLVCKNALAKYQVSDKWDATIISQWLEDKLKSLKDRFVPQILKDWSEEDEKFVHGLIRGLSAKRDIHGHTTFSSDCIDITETIVWLESLKDRVQPQPKQEWSKKDDKMCQETIDWFEKKCFPYALESENPARESIKWLKSLKDRYTWKPSERQKEALLWCVVHLGGADKQTLGELLEELNKL